MILKALMGDLGLLKDRWVDLKEIRFLPFSIGIVFP